MRQRSHRLAVALIFVFVAISAVVSRRGQHVFTGTVREWNAGESITIASEQTDPAGFTVSLRNTRYEGRTDRLAAGSSVTVWYRIIGESRPVADKVRVNEPVSRAPSR